MNNPRDDIEGSILAITEWSWKQLDRKTACSFPWLRTCVRASVQMRDSGVRVKTKSETGERHVVSLAVQKRLWEKYQIVMQI